MPIAFDARSSIHATTARPASDRFIWITPDRVLYAGLLGEPATRTLGSLSVYVAHQGCIRIRLQGGDWATATVAVVPPNVPHQVVSEVPMICVLQLEAETVDMAALPAWLQAAGPVEAPEFVARLRLRQQDIGHRGAELDLHALDFDTQFFGAPLARRPMDARIGKVVDSIKRDPAAAVSAQDCARLVHLSFSRFLHLFKQEAGMPFRSFRTWKRARSLLHHVNRAANLAHVAQDTGYPDSTHFSHSIRQVYGLKPKDIFAGSRHLAIYGPALRPA
jgi:AraC-like DNA-binding protein